MFMVKKWISHLMRISREVADVVSTANRINRDCGSFHSPHSGFVGLRLRLTRPT